MVKLHQTLMVVIPSTQMPRTTVILDSLWWVVLATGFVLEMVAALMVLLVEWRHLVKVINNYSHANEKTNSFFSHNLPCSDKTKKWLSVLW